MGGTEGEVGEEGPVGADRHRVVDELERLVDQVLGEVVALLRRPRRFDAVVVVGEVGGELVGLAVEEPVEPVEARAAAASCRRARRPRPRPSGTGATCRP